MSDKMTLDQVIEGWEEFKVDNIMAFKEWSMSVIQGKTHSLKPLIAVYLTTHRSAIEAGMRPVVYCCDDRTHLPMETRENTLYFCNEEGILYRVMNSETGKYEDLILYRDTFKSFRALLATIGADIKEIEIKYRAPINLGLTAVFEEGNDGS